MKGMKNKMYTIKELSEKLNVSRQTIYNYLRNDDTFKACSTKPFNKYLFNEVMIKDWYENKNKKVEF